MARIKERFHDIIFKSKVNVFIHLLRIILCLLSLVYGIASHLLRCVCFMRRKKLLRPVISIGNITWGGTGKTPLVDYCLKHIVDNDKRAVVLMRGYGNDENTMLHIHYPAVPVISGKNRYANGVSFLMDNDTDVFILDDGMQQWKIHRDLNVVAVNCMNPWGNGWLIPRGCLREPVRQLKRADVVMLTHADLVNDEKRQDIRSIVRQYVADENICEAEHVPISVCEAEYPYRPLSTDTLQGKRAIIFSGIGSPQSFKENVERTGVEVVKEVVYADHHKYTTKELTAILHELRDNPGLIAITTEKDYMRNQDDITLIVNPFVLIIGICITKNKNAFDSRLNRLLDS